jgi:hypothetical protein
MTITNHLYMTRVLIMLFKAVAIALSGRCELNGSSPVKIRNLLVSSAVEVVAILAGGCQTDTARSRLTETFCLGKKGVVDKVRPGPGSIPRMTPSGCSWIRSRGSKGVVVVEEEEEAEEEKKETWDGDAC